MRRFLLALLVATLCTLPARAGEPATEMQDAVRRMEEGLPTVMRALDALAKEAPTLHDIMARAAEKGRAAQPSGKRRVDGNGMPTSEQVAEQYRGMQAMLEVLREAIPVIQRMQKELPGPVRVGPEQGWY